jgi:hypothetical protein
MVLFDFEITIENIVMIGSFSESINLQLRIKDLWIQSATGKGFTDYPLN